MICKVFNEFLPILYIPISEIYLRNNINIYLLIFTYIDAIDCDLKEDNFYYYRNFNNELCYRSSNIF